MSIGEKLAELRKQKNLTQEKVAEELNVTRQTISNWELGQTVPDLEQSKALSKLYQISLDELVDNDMMEVLAEKISNTEKLAGLSIKLLKGIIIGFFCFIVALLISSIAQIRAEDYYVKKSGKFPIGNYHHYHSITSITNQCGNYDPSDIVGR